MRSVLVLGPSRWTQMRVVPGYSGAITPIELRRALATMLIDHGIKAILFEDWTGKPGESHSRAFQRLIRARHVDRFFVLWPKGTSLLGVDWELGFLAGRVESGRLNPGRIVLLLETGVVREDLEAGTYSIGEPGNRTRYFEDLVTWECPISLWTRYEEMLRKGLRRAIEELDQ
jgi:hypothetical protein